MGAPNRHSVRATDHQSTRGQPGILGLGLDGDDGHTRITRGDNFLLLGGSQTTHQVMQETAIKVNERLQDRGMRLDDVSLGELREIVHQVHQDIHGS
jgi:hypothetical protein